MTIVSDSDYESDFEHEGLNEDPTEIVNYDDSDDHDGDTDDDTDGDVDGDIDGAQDEDAELEAEFEDDDETETDVESEDELDASNEAEDSSDHEHEAEDDSSDHEISDREIPDREITDREISDRDLDDAEPVAEVALAEKPSELVEQTEAPVAAGQPARPPQPWSTRQLLSVTQRVLAVFVVMGIVGYGLGVIRGNSHVARTEFVYTLDESVPDSFLREDRRLLTQVVTFKSDAVLTPVAAEFDLTVDQLRTKIEVETLELSEVLRLDVADADAAQALALSEAVLDRYLQVITDATPAGDNEELAQRRIDVSEQLAEADASRRALLETLEDDAVLEVRQASIQRQIDLNNEQVGRILQSLDDAFLRSAGTTQISRITTQLEAAQASLAELEADLSAIGAQRAELATETTAEPALLREIERLEAKLTTIDNELAERELAPLVASPIRELSQPIVLFRSMHLFGLQGMALGLMAGIPLAGFVAYRARQKQLWFD